MFDIKICLCCSDLKPRKKKRKDTSHLPHPVTLKVQVIQNHLLIHHQILRVLQKRNLKNEKRNTRKIPRNIRKKRKRERKARKGQFWDSVLFCCMYTVQYRFLHRLVEWFGLEATFKGHLVQPRCSEQGHLQLDQVAQSPVQPDLECFQGWGLHYLSGNPFQYLITLIVNNVFLMLV